LVEAYEKALENIKGRDALPLLRTLAEAYEKELGNPGAAIEKNETILQIVPNDETVVLALERLYIATGRHEELLSIYDKKLKIASSEEQKRDVRLKLASLYEDQVKDVVRAIELYKDVLVADPQDRQALRALERLYVVTENWKQLALIIEAQIKLESSDHLAKADLVFRYGKVQEEHLGEVAGAVDSFKQALTLDPNHQHARQALEVYLGNAKLQSKAMTALEPIYESLHEIERLIEIQRIKLKKEKTSSGKVALLLRVGSLEKEAGRPEKSYEAYALAFEEDPACTEARVSLEQLAESLGHWESLVALYSEAQANKKLGSTLERELLLVIAVAYDEKLNRS
jgi:tetratricopeptide (TPR) repeat protein